MPFKDGVIDETNVYNQVAVLAVNCMGNAVLKNPWEPEYSKAGEGWIQDVRFEDLLVYDKMIL